MQYLIDTDWVIDHMHGRQEVVSHLEELGPYGLGLSIVSLAELYEGVFYSTDPQSEEHSSLNFLGAVEVIPLDGEICRIFARERGRLRAVGAIIGGLDILIGATALRHDLTLLTNNRRHFQRITGLSIIPI